MNLPKFLQSREGHCGCVRASVCKGHTVSCYTAGTELRSSVLFYKLVSQADATVLKLLSLIQFKN